MRPRPSAILEARFSQRAESGFVLAGIESFDRQPILTILLSDQEEIFDRRGFSSAVDPR